jgi:glycine betaine/proline transport system substrate-binding protein
MKTTTLRKSVGLLAGAALVATVLAACADDEDTGGTGDGALAGETITIGVFSGWEEGIAASFLWGHVFAQEGATVNYEFADPGPIYAGVANGQFDISFDAWLPLTHEDYWQQYGDSLVDLGTWFDEAPLTIAVNSDAPIQSLAELGENADQFDNRIVGIEPGAGLTRITRETVMPTYGLENMTLVESSTPAMLAELQGALDRGEDIVVTLWEPHWAYGAFDIRNLEDPENALGDPEQIHAFARTGFAQDYPEVAGWVGNFSMTADEIADLENYIFFEDEATSEAEYAAAVQRWLDDNPGVLDRMMAG